MIFSSPTTGVTTRSDSLRPTLATLPTFPTTSASSRKWWPDGDAASVDADDRRGRGFWRLPLRIFPGRRAQSPLFGLFRPPRDILVETHLCHSSRPVADIFVACSSLADPSR